MSDTTVHSLRVRVANPPLTVPHATAGGMVASFPMVLLDLRTRGGLVGSAYVFTYTMVAAPSVARLVRELEPLLVGQPAAQRFRLLGPQGFTMMAAAAIDMAAWDVTCKAAGLPLHQMLGGVARGSRGYAPVGLAGEAGAVREALAGTARGFKGVKAKIGYPTLDEDIRVLRAIRDAVGPEVAIFCDYNQALDVPEAIRRGTALDAVPGLGLGWIEEPVTAEDYAGHAAVKAAVHTPVQAGENWWGPLEFRKAINAGATDLLMPDVMKLGGVTPWLDVMAMAQAYAMPLSNHLFPEVSAHLMAVSPTAGWFEWCDWADAVLARPAPVRDGLVWPGDEPGIGVQWDEAAVVRHEVKGA
jgi:mandelate racemase